MVTVIAAGGPDVLAFAISGRLTSEDFQDVLLPPIRETIASGETLRVLAVIDDFRGLEPGALLEDLKAAARLGSGQHSLGIYFAVVTDTDWVRRAISVFGWLVPGEIRVFAGAERADADTWLAASGA